MKKRGQIAVFIFVGIVLVLSVGFFLFFSESKSQSQEEVQMQKASQASLELAPINVYVQSCVEKTVLASIPFINARGGYYNPRLGVDIFSLKVPYYLYDGETYLLSKEDMEKEYYKYIIKELPDCIDNFKSFREMAYGFDLGEISADVSLSDKIIVNVNYPITVKRVDLSGSLSEFYYEAVFDFDRLYGALSEFIGKHEEVDEIPLDYLPYLAEKYDFGSDFVYSGNTTIVYSWVFNGIFGEKEVLFNFAADYSSYDVNASS